MRRLFGYTGLEVKGGWGEVHNEELYNLHSSLNKLVLGRLSRGECTEIKIEHQNLI